MIRLLLYLTLLTTTISLTAQRPVLYGERSSEYHSDATTTRIFIDRNGDFYPELLIKDNDLAASDNNLRAYFAENDQAVEAAQEIYDFEKGRWDHNTFNNLQAEIEKSALQKLNERLAVEAELYILIHGFRKPLQSVPRGTNSKEDFDLVKAAVLENRPESNIHFLEVYWDGTYIDVKPSIGGMIKLGKLFKKSAIDNATKVGLGIRKLIAQIDHPRIHIIAHSLGAQVVNNVLWNADGLISGGLTPTQKIDVCLIAPAIARKPFRKFMERTGVIYLDQDNYTYSIIYNERDIVVAKSNFGKRRYFRFTRFFGNTKLGCNCSREAIKVKKMFNRRYPNSTVRLYDATDVGNNHRWGAYVQSQAFRNYISSF